MRVFVCIKPESNGYSCSMNEVDGASCTVTTRVREKKRSNMTFLLNSLGLNKP